MVRPRSAQWQEGAELSAGLVGDATRSGAEAAAAVLDGKVLPTLTLDASAGEPAGVTPGARPAGTAGPATSVAAAASPADPTAKPVTSVVSTSPPVVAGWVEPEWFSQVISAAVREVMALEPGLELMAALMALPQGACPADHSAEADVASGEVLRWLAADGPVETIAAAGTLSDGTRVRMPAPGSVPGLPCACQLVIAAGWAACAAWVGNRVADAVIDVAGPGPLLLHSDVHPDRMDPASDELAAVLHVSPRSATAQIAAARRRAACTQVAATVDSGLLGAAGGSAIYQVLEHVPTETTEKVSSILAGRIQDRRARGLRGWTPAEARRAARATLLTYSPEEAEQARAEAKESRRVELRHVGDGTSWLSALLPELDALRIHRRLTALGRAQAADAAPADRRHLDQRRADLLAEALLSLGTNLTGGSIDAGTTDGRGPADRSAVSRHIGSLETQGVAGVSQGRAGAGGAPTPGPASSDVQICVVATPETLLGLSQRPAHVPGIGAISADLARELAADGTWGIWLRNAAGHVTAVDPGRYRPTAGVARLIAAREPTCRFPGCLVRVERCDLDHTESWPAAPGSTPENLGPLCRRHHNAKTHHSVVLSAHATGGSGPAMLEHWTWRMPSGLTHTVRTLTPLDNDLGDLPQRNTKQRRRRRTKRKARTSPKAGRRRRNRSRFSHQMSRRIRT